jgi:excisionase family DNA binding protein
MNGQTVQLITQAEAARMTGYSISTIRRLILRGEIEKIVVAPGMKPRVRLADVRRLMERSP